MGTLGIYLKQARETRGLDLREAAQQTRISHAYLTAIEREEFSKLPGEVFVKGFLRNYAKFLGVPEDEVMRLYAESKTPVVTAPPLPLGTAKQEAQPAPVLREPAVIQEGASQEEGRGGDERYIWAAVALIAVAAALLVIVPERPAAKKHAEPVHSEVTGTMRVATASTPTARPDKLYLDVTALEDMWILVRTDSSPQKKAVLKKGESVTWSADERFLLSIGNAGSAKILLNGKELTINAQKNAAVRDIVITATGIIAPKAGPEQARPRKPRPAASVPAPAPAAPPVSAPPQIPAPTEPSPAPETPAPATPGVTQ